MFYNYGKLRTDSTRSTAGRWKWSDPGHVQPLLRPGVF
jgi:hypothetical protein